MRAKAFVAACVSAYCVAGAVAADSGPKHTTSSDPRSRARVHTELGSLYLQENQLSIALDEARTAIAADPDYPQAYNLLGLIYLVMRDAGKSRDAFQRALSLAPNDPDVNNNFGWYLCQTKRERESIRYFVAAASNPLYSTPARSYVNAAMCADRGGDAAEARDYALRAVQADPSNPQAAFFLADLDFRQGRYVEARDGMRRMHATAEPTAASLWLSIRTARRLGDRESEKAAAAQLYQRFPESREYQAYSRGQFE